MIHYAIPLPASCLCFYLKAYSPGPQWTLQTHCPIFRQIDPICPNFIVESNGRGSCSVTAAFLDGPLCNHHAPQGRAGIAQRPQGRACVCPDLKKNFLVITHIGGYNNNRNGDDFYGKAVRHLIKSGCPAGLSRKGIWDGQSVYQKEVRL